MLPLKKLWYIMNNFKIMGGTSCPPPRSVRGSSVLWGGRHFCNLGAPEEVGRQFEWKPPCQRTASPSSSLHLQQSPELWWTSAWMTDHGCPGCCWWSSSPHYGLDPDQGSCTAPWSSGVETWPSLHTWPGTMKIENVSFAHDDKTHHQCMNVCANGWLW